MGLANRSSCENLLAIVRNISLAWRLSASRGAIPVSPEALANTCKLGDLDLKQLLSAYQQRCWPTARMSLMTQGLLHSVNLTLLRGRRVSSSVLSHIPLAFKLPLPILSSDSVSSAVTFPRSAAGATTPFHASVADTTYRSLRGHRHLHLFIRPTKHPTIPLHGIRL
jgi:hypothetical protein